MIRSVLTEIGIRMRHHPFLVAGLIVVAAIILWGGEFNWTIVSACQLFTVIITDSNISITYLLPRSNIEQKKYLLTRVFIITAFYFLLFLGGTVFNTVVYRKTDVAETAPLMLVLWILLVMMCLLDTGLSMEGNKFHVEKKRIFSRWSMWEGICYPVLFISDFYYIFMALAIYLSDEIDAFSVCLKGFTSMAGYLVTVILLAALVIDVGWRCHNITVGDYHE